MSLRRIARKLGIWCLVGAGVLAVTPGAFAGGLLGLGWFDGGCCHQKCPPPFVHCAEGPPKIKFKKGCPKPVCDPCNLPHHGYFRPCWRAWPFPADWSHCHFPPPSVLPPGHAPEILVPQAVTESANPLAEPRTYERR